MACGGNLALLNYLATVGAALNSPGNWCDILILHLNTKYCRASTAGKGVVLNVSIGKKYDQPLDEAYRVAFAYRVAAQTPNYLQVKLNADEGPLSTRNYRIVLEAIPLENGQRSSTSRIRMRMELRDGLRCRPTSEQAGEPRWDSPLPAHNPTASLCTSAECVVWRNAIPCAITWQSRPFLAPCPSRRRRSSKNVCMTGLRHRPSTHFMKGTGRLLDMKRKEYRRQQAELPHALAGDHVALLKNS